MKNYRKETPVGYRSGRSNMNTFNCLNPDNAEVILKGNEWVNPA